MTAENTFLPAVAPALMLILIRFFEKDNLVSGAHREFIIELSIIAAGCAAAVI